MVSVVDPSCKRGGVLSFIEKTREQCCSNNSVTPITLWKMLRLNFTAIEFMLITRWFHMASAIL